MLPYSSSMDEEFVLVVLVRVVVDDVGCEGEFRGEFFVADCGDEWID